MAAGTQTASRPGESPRIRRGLRVTDHEVRCLTEDVRTLTTRTTSAFLELSDLGALRALTRVQASLVANTDNCHQKAILKHPPRCADYAFRTNSTNQKVRIRALQLVRTCQLHKIGPGRLPVHKILLMLSESQRIGHDHLNDHLTIRHNNNTKAVRNNNNHNNDANTTTNKKSPTKTTRL